MTMKSKAQSKIMQHARRKSRAAYGERRDDKLKAAAARNAYRLACGLPLIEAGNGLFTKAHKGD